MTKNDTWFDAFFRTITSSDEFKSIINKDSFWDISNDLKSMENKIKKAWSINESFKDAFDTSEARKIWESYSSKQNLTKTEKKEEKSSTQVKYFENKNPDTFWFAWVAWMKGLLQDLIENFIKPLKFKFLIQKLENDWIKDDDKKSQIYKKINEAYKKFSVSIPTWMLFYWPPGTWKTFITKKLAEELWAWLIKKSVWEFGSSYIHQTSQNIKKFFTEAKKESEKWPIILFLDEIDSLVSKRTGSIDSNKAEEVSQFLQEFNSLEYAPNLIVIAATNRPDHLDGAILRSGRFDKKIYIWEPDFQARKELFKIYIEKAKRPHSKLDYEKLSELTEGYVAADIETICDEVSRDASKSILDLAKTLDWSNVDLSYIEDKLDDQVITMELLEQAIKETTSSLKYTDMSIYEEFKKLD